MTTCICEYCTFNDHCHHNGAAYDTCGFFHTGADTIVRLVTENERLTQAIHAVTEKPIEAAKEIARMKDNLKFCENWNCPFANDTGIAGLKFCFRNGCVRKEG